MLEAALVTSLHEVNCLITNMSQLLVSLQKVLRNIALVTSISSLSSISL